jgi:hypothetical protein
MQNHIVSLLGMKLGDVTQSAFVLSLNEQPTTEKVEDRIYLRFHQSGISFDAEASDGRVAAIFLYSEGYQNYKGFAGSMPDDVSFSNSRRAVQSRMGKPSASGGGKVIQFFGKAPAWDRFDRSEYGSVK